MSSPQPEATAGESRSASASADSSAAAGGGRGTGKVSTDPEVRKFALRMVTDHTAANTAAANLAQRLGVTPQASPTSEGLAADGEKELARLRQLTGAAFDAAYVDREVAYHQQVIAALDGTLIPATSNAELKALLVKVRPNFDTHLEHAKHLQTALGSR